MRCIQHKGAREKHLLILCQHSSIKLAWMRHEVVLSVEFANFEAGVAELREAVPEVLLILQKEDRELARRGATLWIRVLDREPANDLSLHYKCRLQHKGKPSSTCMPSKEQTSVLNARTRFLHLILLFSKTFLV